MEEDARSPAELAHLLRSGDAIGALIAGLSTADLEVGGGRVRRFAQIAIRASG